MTDDLAMRVTSLETAHDLETRELRRDLVEIKASIDDVHSRIDDLHGRITKLREDQETERKLEGEEREKDRKLAAAEKKKDRQWLVTSMIASAGVVVGALAFLMEKI